MKVSNLLIIGGVGVLVYFILKNNKKFGVKKNSSDVKNDSLTNEMNPYLVEETTMRPPLFSDKLVSSFNTNQYATIAPSLLDIYKIK